MRSAWNCIELKPPDTRDRADLKQPDRGGDALVKAGSSLQSSSSCRCLYLVVASAGSSADNYKTHHARGVEYTMTNGHHGTNTEHDTTSIHIFDLRYR